MKKYLIIGLLILVAVILVFIKSTDKEEVKEESKYSKSLQKLLDKKEKYGKLLEVSYSDSGNMLGNIDSHTIYVEKLILEVRYCNEHGEKIKVTEYKVTEEDVKKIDKMIKEYNLKAWADLPLDNDKIALDASTPTIYMAYDESKIKGYNRESYSISYYDKIPDDGYDLLNEVVKSIKSLEKEENMIKSYTEDY